MNGPCPGGRGPGGLGRSQPRACRTNGASSPRSGLHRDPTSTSRKTAPCRYGENPAADTYEIEYALTESGITGLRLELLPDPASPNAWIGRSDNGNVVISEIEVETGAATGDPNFQRLEFVSADVDYAQPNLGIAKAIDGKPDTGYGAGGHEAPGARTAVFVPRAPFGYASGTRLKLRIRHESEFAQHAAARTPAVTANQDMALARLDQW